MNESRTIYPSISERIVSTILSSSTVGVIGHANPDGDCINSTLAMKCMLESLGKKVQIFNEGPFDKKDIRKSEPLFLKEVPEGFLEERPLIIVVDCSTKDRPGRIFSSFEGLTTIVFDHHSAGESFTDEDLQYIVPSSVSTTLVLEKVREALGVPLTRELATYLYLGFATDSGFFHFISEKVGGETLRLVSRFVDAGVSPYIMYDVIHDGQELEFFKAAARIIERVESAFDGRILYSWTYKDDELGSRASDFIYSQLLQVSGVKLVFFFKEKEDAVVCGMRSKNLSQIDVGSFASSFGGGGHMYAAGATIQGSLEDVRKMVISKASILLH
ncbi:MAG: bifunctional oligoribonuclease/PAP phosphatase NrnA [Spirochaetales bacterium]|nr:bifunctional oligoribonuclease/PAP phosphatase NrnA [Spirochaetales bacterium]